MASTFLSNWCKIRIILCKFVPYLERDLISDKVRLVSIVAETEALFGISAKTIRRMIRSGKVPCDRSRFYLQFNFFSRLEFASHPL